VQSAVSALAGVTLLFVAGASIWREAPASTAAIQTVETRNTCARDKVASVLADGRRLSNGTLRGIRQGCDGGSHP
jgi:hypothetical protein